MCNTDEETEAGRELCYPGVAGGALPGEVRSLSTGWPTSHPESEAVSIAQGFQSPAQPRFSLLRIEHTAGDPSVPGGQY